jgi:flavin reductase (DIM6/NTAB) family NADH-FMN oxidoreductase RutF
VLSHFATGVVVICGHDGARPLGFTCQSLVSVSLDPPYISFCPAKTSRTWPRLRAVGDICVNILAHHQRKICWQFATSGGDKFTGIDWAYTANGAPAIDGALAHIEAAVESEHDAGDHTIVLARITDLRAYEAGHPLLFYRGQLAGLAQEAAS